MNKIPDGFTAKYGESILINSGEELDIGSDDYISWHLLNRARDASNIAFAKAGHTALRVSGAYLTGIEPRAFAYWSPTVPQDYVIACTRGTTEVIRRTLVNAEFRSLLPQTSFALSRLHVEDLTALAVSLTLATILYHEVAHVTRFHLPYLTECKETDPSSLPAMRGLCEADADKLCSYLIAPDLLAQAKGIHEALKLTESVESVLREVLILYAVALHLWFTFFNQRALPKASIYPHPLIRSTRITIGAVDNMQTAAIMEPCGIDRVFFILNGLDTVERSALRTGCVAQHSFDLATELNAINTRFEKIEHTLDPALLEVRSRWGAPSAD
ncbi:MAG: hypothetical protein KUG83_07705 [Gammaproteobacteria bacterium]|nr:hypothetical protein [Gammaproteobacteria bacterium]